MTSASSTGAAVPPERPNRFPEVFSPTPETLARHRARVLDPPTALRAPDGSWPLTTAYRADSLLLPAREAQSQARESAKNLRALPVTAQAIPSIAPLQATQYFQKTDCFCFTPQYFTASQERELTVRFIVDSKLPANIDRLTLAYSMYTTDQKRLAQMGLPQVTGGGEPLLNDAVPILANR